METGINAENGSIILCGSKDLEFIAIICFLQDSQLGMARVTYRRICFFAAFAFEND